MKLAYFFTRRQFGKVLTPLKVHSARLPPAFSFFYARIAKLDKKLTLPPEFILLIREQVARINVCQFCMDIARSLTIKASMTREKKVAGYFCTPGGPFYRAADLRNRVARCHGARLQHDEHRPEHPFRHALRDQPEEAGAGAARLKGCADAQRRKRSQSRSLLSKL